MLKALFEIWDGAFCRGVIGFELWIVFVRIIHKSSEPTRASEVGLFADMLSVFKAVRIFVEISISDALLGSEHVSVGGYKISTIAINSKI